MNLLNDWKFWTIIYIISAVVFAHTFKKTNRSMKNPDILTILLELCTAFFSLLFIILFPFKISYNLHVYLILFIVSIIYAFTDRLNIEARYGLEPSTFSMLKQLSTVFIIFFGIIFLNEKIVIKKIIGATIIISSNIFLAYNKGKFSFNKYFIMSVISNVLFAIAMIINVNVAKDFNIAIYTFITVFFPALYIFIVRRYKIKDLKDEFGLYDKKKFLISALMWCIMLISSVKAYEYGNVVVVASFLTLTAIINSAIELVFDHNKKNFLKKFILAVLIVIGVILVKM